MANIDFNIECFNSESLAIGEMSNGSITRQELLNMPWSDYVYYVDKAVEYQKHLKDANKS